MKSELLIVCLLIGFAVLSGHLRRRSKEREARLKLIEKALDKPGLDDVTRRELARFLKDAEPLGARVVRTLASSGSWLRYALFLAGWIGVFVGLGICWFGGVRDRQDGFITMFASFVALTIPFALREFERRKTA